MFRSIDFRQAGILTRYALLSEWRMSSLRFGRRKKMSRAWAYWSMIGYLAIGALTIRFFVGNTSGDTFVTAASIIMLYSAFIIASNIFLSFGNGFLSPDEAQIISPLPVSSETFFFSRLLVLICYTSIISLLLAIGPFVGLEFFLRPALAANLLLLLAMVLSGTAAAMIVIVIYGLLLGRLRAATLTKAIGYVQFLGSFVTAMSFVVFSRVEQFLDLQTLTITVKPWLAVIPSFWFASLAGLGAGAAHGVYLWLAVASLAYLGALAIGSHVLLGKKYQSEIENLAASSSMRAKRKKTSGDSIVYRVYTRFARSDEARAIFVVLRAQFRYDAKFRMQLLSTLPLTFVYIVLAIVGGGISDPFTSTVKETVRPALVYLVALLMPLIVMQSITYSESYKAAWIFFAAPLDRAKLLLAVRNTLLVSIVLPYMIILAVVFSNFMPIFHAVAHVLVLAAVAGFIFQIYLIFAAKMPFAQPRRPNRGSFAMMFGVFVFTILAGGILILEIYFGYESQARFWPSFALLITLSAILERVVHARVRVKLEREEFEG
jgi:ABC-2 type transport system permease protein